MAAARRADLPKNVLKLIDEAKKYAEGRAVRLEVRTKADLAHVATIAACKMDC